MMTLKRWSSLSLAAIFSIACSGGQTDSETDTTEQEYGRCPTNVTWEGSAPFCMEMVRDHGECDSSGCGAKWRVVCSNGRSTYTTYYEIALHFCAGSTPKQRVCTLRSSRCEAASWWQGTYDESVCEYDCSGRIHRSTGWSSCSNGVPRCSSSIVDPGSP